MVQSLVQKRVQHLIEGGLKVLALDFDLTICSIHTRGVYMGTEEDLKRLGFLIIFSHKQYILMLNSIKSNLDVFIAMSLSNNILICAHLLD